MPTITRKYAYTTPGDFTFHVDAAWVNPKAIIRCIGAGVSATAWRAPISPKGGGAGAYAEEDGGGPGVALTPGADIPLHVGAPYISPNQINQGSAEPSWFGHSDISNPACLCLADGGHGVAGGAVLASKGSAKYKGGSSDVNPLDFWPGQGGAGAGGPNGAGKDASSNSGAPGSPGTGHGADADNSAADAGVGGLLGQPGTAGQEFTLDDASKIGSGGGGGSGMTMAQNGGAGGAFGGGGGTGADAIYDGGIASGGMVLIEVTRDRAPRRASRVSVALIPMRVGVPV